MPDQDVKNNLENMEVNNMDDFNASLSERTAKALQSQYQMQGQQDVSVSPTQKPSYHFRMIKTDTHSEPTRATYIKWGAVAIIVGVSLMSFLTQSVLAVRDIVFNRPDGVSVSDYVSAYIKGDGGNLATNSANGRGSTSGAGTSDAEKNSSSDADRNLGSDDADNIDDANATYDAGNINANNGKAGNQYRVQNASSFPRVTAKSFLAADLKTGEIILEQNQDLVAPIASVSKLMTGLVAEEKMDLQKMAIVSRDSYNTYGAQGSLVLGEKIRLYDLMYPLLMESSNDAAEVIADAYPAGHVEFLAEMNKKAKELGMKDTYYEDPSGLDPKNVSSVHDLLKLARYIYQNKPVIYDMTRVRNYAILKHQWNNLNRFLNYDTFLGGKNGYIDESRKTGVSLFDVTMAKGGKRSVVIVLLKSDDREGDAVKIMNFLKKNAIFNEGV